MTSRFHERRRRPWRARASTGLLLLLAACKGDSLPKARVLPEPPPTHAEGCENTSADPGRVTLHRLNRAEYDATVRDLLGDTTRPARDFPADDHGYGFDNNADVLSLSPLLLEKYATAAEKLVENAWAQGTVRTCTLDATNPEPCARDILSRFARRAWRRPVTPEEVDRLLGALTLAKRHGDPPEAGVKLALRTVLVSPHFLFRVEKDPQATSLSPHRLDAFELASRLSYFLWSSMPDEALLQAAEQGQLSTPEQLEAQVRRMLADPKAQALVSNFAGQWLFTRALASAEPDPMLYGTFNEDLRQAMRQETELVFQEFLTGDHKLRDLLDAPFTYVNDALAAHYGLPLPGSATPKRVDLSAHPERQGIFGHGSLLTVTSNPDRTSPVQRGVWVLEQLLCSAPPPPPPNVEGLPPPVNPLMTMKERMALHRSLPQCQGCHRMMDPLGLALENYDPIGRWRLNEVSGAPVDATGDLPDGAVLNGGADMRRFVKEDPKLPACITEHLLTYALGRGMSEADACVVREISASAEASGGRLVDYILAIVLSDSFTSRRGDTEAQTP
ncbi:MULTISPECIES: DUF1592 domain-containing protein [unclassified Myxococcus]|uniref:DUF1592 domain-containing protein n=1 Tax=unclassified Myxococcus TaxID=2648731 RepID=UPI001CBCC97F|nr:DUF1592 domain-containing protein [Myxococcus sp. AS-1-15]MBZ4412639.1 DUF1592 domain-containing protein [Myxococcus sp. XM-1-1-1]